MTKPIDDAWIVTGSFFVWLLGGGALALILPPVNFGTAVFVTIVWTALVIWAAVRLGKGSAT